MFIEMGLEFCLMEEQILIFWNLKKIDQRVQVSTISAVSYTHLLKYFCFGVNDQVDKFSDYVFSLECNEKIIEKVSGTKDGARNGKGNQIIIPNDYIPYEKFERIKNRLGIYISAVRKDGLADYLSLYDNRPYLAEDIDIEIEDEDPEEHNKRLFRYWMSCQVKPEGDSDADVYKRQLLRRVKKDTLMIQKTEDLL